ncbi:MAG TPA: LacI family DNA-binding transcriptional regulator [Ktedonosporobacter sp.]|nr:LacI family DNA-binding transcriptional regulator [Ktedonosporobacter sp.]
MRRKLITIRDVAEHAGVSASTVSHVLNGNAQHVGDVKRKRVLEAVELLRYRPNAIARSMVRQQTATIGLVLTEIDNPLFIPVVAGVEDVLRPAGYHIVLASSTDVESEIQAIETLRSQQVDGFIFMSLSLCYPIDHLLHLKDEGVPFVVINRCMDDPHINQISWEDYETGYAATSHLISLGHTRIGTISGPIHNDPPRRSAIERHRGWQQAMQDHGLERVQEWQVEGYYTYEGGYQAAQHIAAQTRRPDALFVASDIMAVSTLKAMHEAGLQVPQDMAIVTMGDPPFAAYTVPGLTTFELPVFEAGQEAARIVLNGLTAGQPTTTQPIVLSCRLRIRESCGAQLTPGKTLPHLSP